MTRNNDKAGQIMQKEEVKDQKMLQFIQDNENLQKLVDKFGIILKNGNEDQFVTKWAFSPSVDSNDFMNLYSYEFFDKDLINNLETQYNKIKDKSANFTQVLTQ